MMDVFANFTKGQRLSQMWPHLLAKEAGGAIEPWKSGSLLSQLFNNTFFMLLFFIFVYVGSLTPHIIAYSRQSVLDIDLFSTQTAPVLWIRGIPIIALLILASVRKNLIALFKNQDALADLFSIKRGLSYWSQFAISRFTGYQKPGSVWTINAVVLFGGVPSFILLFLTWAITLLSDAALMCSERGYDVVTELTFWLIMSFAFGIISWNLVVVPVYILNGIENIPLRVDIYGRVIGVKVIQRALRYSNEGIFVLIMSAIALSIVPIFVADEQELQWVMMWAQSALIFCLLVLCLRFDVKGASNRGDKIMGIVKTLCILSVYIVIMVWHGFVTDTIRWLGIGDAISINKYAELVVFSGMAAYLFYSVGYGKIGMVNNIKGKARKGKVDELMNKLEVAEKQKDANEGDRIRGQLRGIESIGSKSEGKFVTWAGALVIAVVGGATPKLIELITYVVGAR